MTDLEIELGTFVVRSYRPGDAATLVAAADNPKVFANLRDRFPHPYTRAHARSYIEMASTARPEVQFAIARGDEVIGGIGFQLLDDVERLTAELGFFLGEPHWDQGITTKAIRAIVDYAFATYGVIRLHCQVFAINGASARVLEKCGFTREGTLRRAVIKADQIMDMHIYSRLKDDPT